MERRSRRSSAGKAWRRASRSRRRLVSSANWPGMFVVPQTQKQLPLVGTAAAADSQR